MKTIETMDGGNVEKPTGLKPSDGQPPELPVADASISQAASHVAPRRPSWVRRLARGVLALLPIAVPIADTAVNATQAAAEEFSKQQSAHTLVQKTPSHGTVAEDVETIKSLQTNPEPVVPVKIEASASVTDTLKAPLVVDREWVEQVSHSINVVAEADVTDINNGDLIKQYAILDDSILYEMHLEGGVYTARKAVSRVPNDYIQSMAATLDGQTLVVGARPGKILLSTNAGQNWADKTVEFPPDLEGVSQITRLAGDTFIANNSKFEAGSNQILFEIDNGKFVNVKSITYQDAKGNPVALGSAREMGLMSLDKNSGMATMISSGSTQLLEGLLVLNVDTKAGTGTVKQIAQVKVAGQQNPVNLGYVYGVAFYTDNGQSHVKTINDTLQTIFDVNLADSTATMFYFGNVLDDKGIADYNPGTLGLGSLRIDTDSAGNRWTRAAGMAGSSKVGTRAIVLTLEKPEDFVDLFPNVRSGVGQGGMQQKQIKGQLVEDFTILNGGKAILTSDNRLLFTDGDFTDKKVPGQVTAVVYLPVVMKNSSSGW